MFSKRRPSLLLLMLFVLLLPCAAQNRKSTVRAAAGNSSTLTSVRVRGSKRFDSDALIAIAGLKLGTNVNEGEMRAGADQLAQTGMFTDVRYTYETTPTGTRVEFTVNDTEELYPAHFDNFVWMSRDELIKALQQRIPLFRGEVPGAGEMANQIADEMRAILAERNVNADVAVLPEAPQEGGRIVGFNYKVQGINIPIRSFEYPGASPEIAPLLQKAAARDLGADYSKAAMNAQSRLDLLPVYLQRGFLRASFGGAETSLVDPATNGVKVSVPVNEGAQYTLDAVHWSGNQAFSTAELSKFLKVAVGKPADQLQLEDDLGGLRKIYGTKGYLRAQITPKPSLDDAARKVVYTVEIAEGDQFHMGAVAFKGVSPELEAKIRPLWHLRAGDVFDTSYVPMFFHTLETRFDVSSIAVTWTQSVHEDTKLVDVTITFRVKK